MKSRRPGWLVALSSFCAVAFVAAAFAAGPAPAVPFTVRATAAGPADHGITRFQLPGVEHNLAALRFLNDHYVATTAGGLVLLSPDAVTWEAAPVGAVLPLDRVYWDGKNYGVLTASNGLIGHRAYISTDGKAWKEDQKTPRLLFLDRTAQGVFGLKTTLANTLVAGPDLTATASFDPADGRLNRLPVQATFAAQDCVFALTYSGFFVSRDRDMWRQEFSFPFAGSIGAAWLAEGNGATVVSWAVTDPAGPNLAAAGAWRYQGVGWRPIEVPWFQPRGLAFGLGRFVMLAQAAADRPDLLLYESTSGSMWTEVGPVPASASALAFGPAGFLVGNGQGGFMLYAPPGKPATAGPAYPAIKLPPITPKPVEANSHKGARAPEPSPAEQQLKRLPTADMKERLALALELAGDGIFYRNPWQAEALLQAALDAKHPWAPRYAAAIRAKLHPSTPAETLALHRQGAEWGDTESMIILARALYAGKDVKADPVEGEKWLQAASAAGSSSARDLLAQFQAAAARAAARPAPDGKAGPLAASVFDVLGAVQRNSPPQLDQSALESLFKAVWGDADYDAAEQDLAAELAVTEPRPLELTCTDGRKLTFNKPLTPTLAKAFATLLPTDPEAITEIAYATLFMRTQCAGHLVAGTRKLPDGINVLARRVGEFLASASKTGRLPDVATRIDATDTNAEPSVRAEFRTVMRAAVDKARQAGATNLDSLATHAWLQAP